MYPGPVARDPAHRAGLQSKRYRGRPSGLAEVFVIFSPKGFCGGPIICDRKHG